MSEQWFYATSGTRHGPVGYDVLRQLGAAGTLQPDDLVWCEGMPQWVAAHTVDGLLPVFGVPRLAVAAQPSPSPTPLERWASQHTPLEAEPLAEYDRAPEGRRREALRAGPRSAGRPSWDAQTVVLGCLGILTLIVVGVAVAVFTQAAKEPTNIRKFPIRAGEAKSYEVELPAGQKIQVWVTSERNTDIDLFVWDPYGRLIHKDERDFKDCYVELVTQAAGVYRFDVRNINLNSKLPVGNNHCTLRIEPPAKLTALR